MSDEPKVKADEAISGSDEIAAQMMIRQERMSEAVDRGLRQCQLRGVPPAGGLKLSILGAVAGEIEHMKREILLELRANYLERMQLPAVDEGERGDAN